MSTFYHNTLLSSYILNGFRRLIGGKLLQLSLEQPDVKLPPSFNLANNGRAVLAFATVENTVAYVSVESLFQEIPPYIDSGGFKFVHHWFTEMKSTNPLYYTNRNPRNLLFNGTSSFSYAVSSPIVSFRFYGDHERRFLHETEPEILLADHLEDIRKFGYFEDPKLEVDTIEFFVVTHANGAQTIVSCDEGRLTYTINTFDDLSENRFEGCYMIINGAVKNIILQHEVS